MPRPSPTACDVRRLLTPCGGQVKSGGGWMWERTRPKLGRGVYSRLCLPSMALAPPARARGRRGRSEDARPDSIRRELNLSNMEFFDYGYSQTLQHLLSKVQSEISGFCH